MSMSETPTKPCPKCGTPMTPECRVCWNCPKCQIQWGPGPPLSVSLGLYNNLFTPGA